MVKKSITFVATKYRNQPVNVAFYTVNGNKVNFIAREKVPVKEMVRFQIRKR